MTIDGRLAGGMGVLAAVVGSGSFVRAAELLDMSQPGVSRAIARLEARLGVRVLDRTTRSVSLTDEGRRFYEHVAPLLDRLEEAAGMASGSANAVRGRLRVNLDPFLSRLLLAPRLGELLDRYPELELELVTRDHLGDLVADGFDLALRFGPPPSSTLIGRKLFDTKIKTVAAPAYLARYGRPATPQALESSGHACIHFRDPLTGRPFPWEFHRGRKQFSAAVHSRLTVNDAGTLYAACLAGHGIAQMMDLGIAPYLRDGALIDLFPDWPDERFPLFALYPSRHLPAAKVRAFLDFVAVLI